MLNRLGPAAPRPRDADLGALAASLARIEQLELANAQRLDHLSSQVDKLQRETRLLLGQLSLPPNSLWAPRSSSPDDAPGAHAFPCSAVCRQESFEQPYFAYWTRKVGADLIYHRKVWEFVFICQALWERGVIRPGARGLGFGVGREPLAAYFAAEGCRVVGTDMAAADAAASGWSDTAQHAAGIEALRHASVCPNSLFDQNVDFRVCDMNAIPDDLTDFDFCWSACAFEHLGSIEHGFRFVERSIDCLKPGGWAVHTTEFNLSSNDHTVAQGGTVLFRRRDMEELAARLTARGHKVAPFDFEPGLRPLDRYIDVAPYRSEPHLKLVLEGYAATSIGIIAQKGD
jgi:2-polyprenyl-3-methyl-5-hydroxy-6-metoxy-1,4-benzoquinol methylase